MSSSAFSRIHLALRTLARKILRTRVLFWLAVLFIAIPVAYVSWKENIWEFRGGVEDRHAQTTPQELFNDNYTQVRYLQQGWTPGQSEWFYTTTQGSDLLPYDFFLALEQADGKRAFRSDENVQRWRYLPQHASDQNPDALPVGFVRDNYKGRDYLGFSCSACHTGQVNYKGTALRIDGGPSMADMDTFMHDLSAALDATAQTKDNKCAAEMCSRFVSAVLKRSNYRDEAAVLADLETYRHRIKAYTLINESHTTGAKGTPENPVTYGYARLDAFGRIYNRVLEHLIQKPELTELISEIYPANEVDAVRAALKPVMTDAQEDHVIERALPLLNDAQRKRLLTRLFNSPNAPVSYPFLWDITQHDYVQWNGLAANEGLGPVGRNAGEVIGVFGTLDWQIKPGFSVPSLIAGQGVKKTYISFESSVRVHNLHRIESQLKQLESPRWPEDVLGKIDRTRAERGEPLFDTHCASCHAEIDSRSKDRRVVANMSGLDVVKTDPTMALNSITYSGYSGILRNEYVGTLTVGDILLDKQAPVAALLTKSTTGVVATPYPENILVHSWEWLIDIANAFFSNKIKPSIKHGDYSPDTTADPYASLLAYKGRSLNGIWATAPFLHNGSIPTIYDLLLPKRQGGDPADGEYRPDSFVVGSREYDPAKAGYINQGYAGFTFNANLPTNSNAGHEYGTIHDPTLAPRGLKPLTKEERLDLLEYIKTL